MNIKKPYRKYNFPHSNCIQAFGMMMTMVLLGELTLCARYCGGTDFIQIHFMELPHLIPVTWEKYNF